MNNKYQKGLISICVPTYNRSNLIGKLLDSILAQTYNNFEVIITDNSDNLKTKELIESKYHDERIKYYKNEKNLGMDGNSLKALSFVNGEYFTFTPDDDIWIDGRKLEKQILLLQDNTNINAVFSNAKHIFKDGSKHKAQFESIHKENCMVISSKDLLLTETPEHFICILTGLMRSSYLDLFLKSWEFGSEEMFMWYLGGTGENIGFCYDELVAIRDGDHNWEVQGSNGELINFKKDDSRRAKQLIEIFNYLKINHSQELIFFTKDTENIILKILFNLNNVKIINYLKYFNHSSLKIKYYLLYLLKEIKCSIGSKTNV